MRFRLRFAVCGGAIAVAVLLCWLIIRRSAPPAAVGPAATAQVQITRLDPVAATRAGLPELFPVSWSRAEAVRHLQQYFSRELLRQEIELGQARYRGQYWEAEPGLPELQQLETRRGEIVRRLATEMNGLLAAMCPDEPGEPLALTAFFSLDHPAPNLGFLSAASREKVEDVLLAAEGPVAAARVLSGQELVDYLNWNAPLSAALRNRLAGLAPDESEFAAIRQWQAAAGSEEEAGARTELARQLGPARLAQLEWQIGPEMSTAVQDMRRLGLPVEQAAWLAEFRRQASGQLQRAWGDPWLDAGGRQARVGLLERAFRAELAAQLALPAGGEELLP